MLLPTTAQDYSLGTDSQESLLWPPLSPTVLPLHFSFSFFPHKGESSVLPVPALGAFIGLVAGPLQA